MNEEKNQNKTNRFISLSEASQLSGVSRDYLNVLIRRGKLQAIKEGKNWLTTKGWIDACRAPRAIENIKTNGEYLSLFNASKIVSVSQGYLNVAVRRGKLRAVKLGRNWFTTNEWLDEYRKPAVSVSEASLAQAERDELNELKTRLALEKESRIEKSAFRNFEISKKTAAFIASQEIKLPARKLEAGEKSKILEAANEQIKLNDAARLQTDSEWIGASKKSGWPSIKVFLTSGVAVIALAAVVGFSSGSIPRQGLENLKYQATLFSDSWKDFSNDLPAFSNWLASGIDKTIAFLKPKKQSSELTADDLKLAESKIAAPGESFPSVNTLADAEALDSLAEVSAIAGVGTQESKTGTSVSVSGGMFTLLDNRLSIVETTLEEQSNLVNAELSIQKKTILGALNAIFGIAQFIPAYPLSTMVVQGSPASLTTYAVAPQVQSGFDRLSATYLNLASNAEINGSLTVKSGATLNSLSVTTDAAILGNATIGGTLAVTGDTTLSNLTLSGTLNALNSQFNLNSASTTDITVSGNAWINKLAVTGTATSTFNNPITSFSGDFIVAADSANNLLLNPYGGFVGIGTTTPGSLFSVHSSGNVYFGGNLTVSGNSILNNSSTTNSTLTNFWSTNGTITNASTTYATISDTAWINNLVATNATTTTFRASGLATFGSSVGIATTTIPSSYGFNIATSTFTYGNQFVSGGLGVGVATTTNGVIQTSGDISVGGNFYVSGDSTVIGASSANTLTVNSSITSNLVPDQNAVRDLGSTSYYWNNGYINTLTVNNISAASTTIGGTQSETFTINSDNATADTETQSLIFFRGTVVPNAILSWNSDGNKKRFEFNQAVYVSDGNASTTNPTFTIQSIANQTANALQILDNNSSAYFSVNPFGSNTTMVNASSTYFTISDTAWINNLVATNATTTTFRSSGLATFGGNMGIGTTTPGFALSVAGQCVTGDTKLRRRKKRRGKNGEIEYEYDEVAIKDISSGDEIASLDEKTGQIVWSRVNALMDMGVKPIYKLETEDGKTIRTTGNHPYLVRTSSSINFISKFYTRYIKNFFLSKEFYPQFPYAKTMRRGTHISERFSKLHRVFGLKKMPQFLFNSFSQFFVKSFQFAFRSIYQSVFPAHNYAGYTLTRPALISLSAFSYSRFITFLYSSLNGQRSSSVSINFPSETDSYSLSGSFSNNFSSIRHTNSQNANKSKRNHAGLPSWSTPATALNLLGSLASLGTRREKYSTFPPAGTSDNNFEDFSIIQKHNTKVEDYPSSARWTKVANLIIGDEIAVAALEGVKFVKIKKIEILPAEQVYDIEVEGTHNFIGNDIVAHNTYLSATTTLSNDLVVDNNTLFVDSANNRVGIGTTTPGSLLSVHSTGNTYLGGNLTVSGNSIFNNASSTNFTATNFWSTNGTITNASTTYATIPTFWSSSANITGGTITGITDLTVADGGTGASTLTGFLYGNGTSPITGTTTPYFGTGFSTNTASSTYLTVSDTAWINNLVATNATTTTFRSSGLATFGGNVGIGTTAPGAPLHIRPTVGASQGYVTDLRLGTSRFGTEVSGGVALDFMESGGTINVSRILSEVIASSEWATSFWTADASNNLLRVMTFRESGNVGIGTTGPGEALQVVGNIKLSGNVKDDTYSGTSIALDNDLTLSANRDVYIDIGVVFKDGGNVGIGTISPGALLDVNGTARINGILTATSSVYLATVDGNVGVGTSTGLFAKLTVAGGGSTSATAALSVINNASTSLLFVRNDGNVGIGTTGPGAKLEVNGAIKGTSLALGGATIGSNALAVTGTSLFSGDIEFPSGQNIRIRDAGTYVSLDIIGQSDDGVHFSSGGDSGGSNNNFIFTTYNNRTIDHDHDTLSANPTIFINSSTNPDTNNTEWGSLSFEGTGSGGGYFKIANGVGDIALMPTGNVGIGTISPGALLDVNGTARINGILTATSSVYLATVDGNVGVGTSTGLFAKLTVAGGGSTSATAALSVINNASTSLLFVRNDGNVGIGTTTPGSLFSVHSTGNTYLGGDLTVSGQASLVNASTSILTAPTFFSTTGTITNASSTNLTATNFWSTNGTITNASTTYLTVGNSAWFGNATTSALSVTGGSSFAAASFSGNVGIGTTTPGQLFSVNGNGYFAGNLSIATTTTMFNASSTNLSILSTGSFNLNATGTMQGYALCTSGNGICGGGLTGTQGQLAYFSGTDTAVGTSTIFISTAGNVGIGTTGPGGRLQINSPTDNTDQLLLGFPAGSDGEYFGILFQVNSGSYKYARIVGGTENYNSDLGYLAFQTNSITGAGNNPAERVRITSAGNVGIGTSTVSSRLSVQGGGGNIASLYDSVGSEKVTITNAGNVGIGTTGPSQKLDVFSTGTTAAKFQLNSGAQNFTIEGKSLSDSFGAADRVYLTSNLTDLFLTTAQNNQSPNSGHPFIALNDGGNIRIVADSAAGVSSGITLDTAGNVGIGTITPGALLDVNGTARINGILTATSSVYLATVDGNVGVGTSTGLFAKLTVAGGGSTSATAALSVINNASTSLLFVRNDGNVGIGTTTPGSLFSVHSTGNTYLGGDLTVSGTANSIGTTTMNGFNLCTSANGVCASGLTGTTGQIAYFSGTDTAVGTSTIFISTAGYVGVGTTSPISLFSVATSTNIFSVSLSGNTSIGSVGGFSDTVSVASTTGGNPLGQGNSIAFSPDGTYIAFGGSTSPFIHVYKRSGDTFTKLTDPAAAAGSGYGASFSPDGKYVAYALDTSPFVNIYKRSGDTFTKLTNPAAAGGIGIAAAFSPDNKYLVIAHNTSPFITIYKRSNDTFTKLANPAALPAGNGRSLSFSPDGTYLAVGVATSPFIHIYKRSGDTFTKLTDPAAATDIAAGASFSPDGTYLALAVASTPYINVYKSLGDTFIKLSNPTAAAGAGNGASFSPDGTYLALAVGTSPYINIYKRSDDTFVKMANPTAAAGAGYGASFSPDGKYVALAHATWPFITVYVGSGSAMRRLELATHTTADQGLSIGKEISLYRSGPSILSLSAGNNFNIDYGQLTMGNSTTSPLSVVIDSSQRGFFSGLNIATSTVLSSLGYGVNIATSTSFYGNLVVNSGNVGIGTTTPTTNLTISTAGSTANAAVTNGWLCVDNDGGCVGGTAGTIYYVASATGNSDIAENYQSEEALEAGEIVQISTTPTQSPPYQGGEKEGVGFQIERATSTSQTIIGIISTAPGNLLGYNVETASTSYPVALSGRVPVKVSLENGPIAIGDKISASSIPGVGKRAGVGEATVGMALEGFDGMTPTQPPLSPPYQGGETGEVGGEAEGVGKIMVFVSLGSPNLAAAQGTGDLASMVTASADINMNGFALLNVKSITGMNGLWRIDENGNITAQSVETQKLTIGGGAASGVTIYDRETTAPKCIYIEGGVIKTSDGACGSTANTGAEAVIQQAADTTPTQPPLSPPYQGGETGEVGGEEEGVIIATSTPPVVEEPPIATSTPEIITATSTVETATSTETGINGTMVNGEVVSTDGNFGTGTTTP